LKTEPAAAFIGLGAMGAPMAHRLHQARQLAAVWNRSSERLGRFVADHPVQAAAGPAEAACAAPVVFVCVSADADVLQVVDQMGPGLGQDSVVIDCSTVSRDTAVRAAQRVARRGAAFLDAPVSGGVEGARNGTLAMMVGGDARVLESVRPLLATLAARVTLMGDTGSGQATKAVNQIMAAGINQAVSEALAFAQAHKLPMQKVIEVVGSGAAGNWFLDHRGASVIEGRFEPGFKVDLHRKDLLICRRMAETLGVTLPLVDLTLADYRRLREAGFGDEDISALFRQKAALFTAGGT
jgi:3-hydroxyisobutyrate dehydrogenase